MEADDRHYPYKLTRVDKGFICIEEEKANKNYPIPKWIKFCDTMLDLGFVVRLHKSNTTRSKYVYIEKDGKVTKIRFSNHKPARNQEEINDSDFYVGVSHKDCITTEKVIEKIKNLYSIDDSDDLDLSQYSFAKKA